MPGLCPAFALQQPPDDRAESSVVRVVDLGDGEAPRLPPALREHAPALAHRSPHVVRQGSRREQRGKPQVGPPNATGPCPAPRTCGSRRGASRVDTCYLDVHTHRLHRDVRDRREQQLLQPELNLFHGPELSAQPSRARLIFGRLRAPPAGASLKVTAPQKLRQSPRTGSRRRPWPRPRCAGHVGRLAGPRTGGSPGRSRAAPGRHTARHRTPGAAAGPGRSSPPGPGSARPTHLVGQAAGEPVGEDLRRIRATANPTTRASSLQATASTRRRLAGRSSCAHTRSTEVRTTRRSSGGRGTLCLCQETAVPSAGPGP